MDPGMIPMVQSEITSLYQAVAIVAYSYFGFIVLAIAIWALWAIYHRNDKEV